MLAEDLGHPVKLINYCGNEKLKTYKTEWIKGLK